MPPESHTLQSGIHWRGNLPRHFQLLSLNANPEATSIQVRDGLTKIWTMLSDLRNGKLRDFQNEAKAAEEVPRVEPERLSMVLLYGRRVFDEKVHVKPIVPLKFRPRLLRYLGEGPYPSLHWKSSKDPRHNPTHPHSLQTDFAIQLTADSILAVCRGIVEIHKLISDLSLPFVCIRSSAGFKREDHRSWIDFHDGINNMDLRTRRLAIEVVDEEPKWMLGGAYMAFFKIAVNLSAWRTLERSQQELIVGRDKFWGCPVESTAFDTHGNAIPVLATGCPFNGKFDNSSPPTIIDPGQATDRLVAASHIHRANLLRLDPIVDDDAANRIYRQGFEFFDHVADGQIHLGLNFVGFVRSLRVINDILTTTGWMADVNFGGEEAHAHGYPLNVDLMLIEYGQYFCAPPDLLPFPGAQLFDD